MIQDNNRHRANASVMSTSLSLFIHRITPRRWLTRCAGWLAACRQPWVAQPLIRGYAKWYGIDLAEALHADPRAYDSFNAFFTRALRPGARKLADADWTSPADGIVSQFGRISLGQMIQAKQRRYSGAALLADADLARALEGGWFTTIYLSPRDYHRVHMPCEGRLLGMRHVPGTLYSVRPEIVQHMDGLLARNERLVCWFEHPLHGVYAMVLVGAAIVGSIATAWPGGAAGPAYPAMGLRRPGPLALAARRRNGTFPVGVDRGVADAGQRLAVPSRLEDRARRQIGTSHGRPALTPAVARPCFPGYPAPACGTARVRSQRR
jgi:phosphatidylserine decarboxylase